MPVREFLKGLDQRTYARFLWSLEQLEQRNVQAREPLVRHVEGKIWELREESNTNIYRILYFFLHRAADRVAARVWQKNQEAATPRTGVGVQPTGAFPGARRGVNDLMTESYTQRDGQRLFREDRALALTDPQFRAIYEEEATQKELWLQLVEARKTTGLTQEQVAGRMGISQAQVARIEKRGYANYTLRTLRRYLDALGSHFLLRIEVEDGLSG